MVSEQYVLGVRVEGPRSARQLLIEPHLAELEQAEGTVLCEYGPVSVIWSKPTGGTILTFNLGIPEGCNATVHIPIGLIDKELVVDSRELDRNGFPVAGQVRLDGSFANFELGPGRHKGKSNIK